MKRDYTSVELLESSVAEGGGSKSFKRRFTVFVLKLIGCLIFLFALAEGASFFTLYYKQYKVILIEEFEGRRNTIGEFLLTPSSVKYNLVHKEVTDLDLHIIVENKSREYGISSAILWAVIDKESNKRFDRFRFETSWKNAYAKNFPRNGLNAEEYDLLFSSFGLMQIGYPIWKDFCGVDSFVELFDPLKNVDCGARILRQCFDSHKKIKPNRKRLWTCFRQYNGSGPAAEQYADVVMSRLHDYMISDLDYPRHLENEKILNKNSNKSTN